MRRGGLRGLPLSTVVDIVYLVRPGEVNEPLRFSLRSLANVDHDRVWLVGHKPRWVSGVEHLPTVQDSERFENTLAGVMAACTHPDISEDFQLWNDDFYALKPTTIPLWHNGPIAENERRNRNRASWLEGKQQTLHLLRGWGFDPVYDYSVHVPMVFNRQLMADALARAAETTPIRALHRRTLYGNLHQVGGQLHGDVKILNKNDVPTPDQAWVSSGDRSFNGNLGRALRDLFGDPSPYEAFDFSPEEITRPKGGGMSATFKNKSTGQVVTLDEDDPRINRLSRMTHRWDQIGDAEASTPGGVDMKAKVDDIVAAVGDDAELAAEALDTELAAKKPRKSLIEALSAIAEPGEE
jgi:hypothetical protein